MKTRHFFLLYLVALAILLLVTPFSSVKEDVNLFAEEPEKIMEIETWMYSDEYFSPLIVDETLEIEAWMIDDRYWK